MTKKIRLARIKKRLFRDTFNLSPPSAWIIKTSLQKVHKIGFFIVKYSIKK